MIRKQETSGDSQPERVTLDTAKEVLCMLPLWPLRARKRDIAADIGSSLYDVDAALDRIRTRLGVGVMDYLGGVCVNPQDWFRAQQIGQWYWDEKHSKEANA